MCRGPTLNTKGKVGWSQDSLLSASWLRCTVTSCHTPALPRVPGHSGVCPQAMSHHKLFLLSLNCFCFMFDHSNKKRNELLNCTCVEPTQKVMNLWWFLSGLEIAFIVSYGTKRPESLIFAGEMVLSMDSTARTSQGALPACLYPVMMTVPKIQVMTPRVQVRDHLPEPM